MTITMRRRMAPGVLAAIAAGIAILLGILAWREAGPEPVRDIVKPVAVPELKR